MSLKGNVSGLEFYIVLLSEKDWTKGRHSCDRMSALMHDLYHADSSIITVYVEDN